MTMHDRRRFSLLIPLLVAILVLSGCAPRVGAGTVVDSSDDDVAYLDMAAFLVEYDETGEASLFGTPVSELGDILGTDLSSLSLSEETIQTMLDNNIQHIQIDKHPGGLRIYMNGNALPSLIWDEQSIDALAQTLDLFGTDASMLTGLLPIITNLGVGITLKMPVRAGQSEIALRPSDRAILDVNKAKSLFDAARNTQPTLAPMLVYDTSGKFEIQGIAQFMLGMIPIPWDQLEQPPETIESLMEQGIESVNIAIVGNGLLLTINGNTLPFIQWNNSRELSAMLQMVGIMLEGDDDSGGTDMGAMLGMMQPIFGIPGLNFGVTIPAASE
ncbi:hypothetical protein KFU94_30660 [Chloroflexi bacterium TSY]|nr:hypothetical protein [Chloroflexi bacterium TSY]